MKTFKQYIAEGTGDVNAGIAAAEQLIKSALGITVTFMHKTSIATASIASKPPRGWKTKIKSAVDKSSDLKLNYMEGDYISITHSGSGTEIVFNKDRVQGAWVVVS